MDIDLPADQKKWLESEVAAGRCASIGEAVEMAIAGLMIDEEDDLAWAKPAIDQARACIADGDVLTGDAFFGFSTTRSPNCAPNGPACRLGGDQGGYSRNHVLLEEKAERATAERYLRHFAGAAARLIEMPRCGASRPALGPQTRRPVIRPYVLIYDHDPAEGTVMLLRILHGRRRITTAMLSRDQVPREFQAEPAREPSRTAPFPLSIAHDHSEPFAERRRIQESRAGL